MTEKQNPVLAATSKPGAEKTLTINPNTKTAAVLRAFLQCGERGLNCFEAVPACHDYVLRSTVSFIERRYGITFDRKWEQVRGYNGSTVDCVRYWIAPQSVHAVRSLLAAGEASRECADASEGLS